MHLRHASQPEKFPVIHGMPQLAPWWAAGYSFSRGHFVVNVPYDWLSPMIFQGEEMSIGIRKSQQRTSS
jgi:[Skp1-protein]-hydroxyproline N-acetylglucosaminyltransferase